MLKNLGKDLWTALKSCISRVSKKKGTEPGYDRLVLTMVHGDTELNLALENIGAGDQERIEYFIRDALPKLVKLHRELQEKDGHSAAPRMVVPKPTERVSLVFDGQHIVLARPVCLSCSYLMSDYLQSPCRTCIHYHEKPGEHRGRPGVTEWSPEGTVTVFDDFNEPIAGTYLVDYSERTDNYNAFQS